MSEILFPVKRNGTVLNIADDNTIADYGSQVLAVKNSTVTFTTTFCEELPSSKCAQQLYIGDIAHCSTQPSHLELLVIVHDDIIIISNGTALLNTDVSLRKGVLENI